MAVELQTPGVIKTRDLYDLLREAGIDLPEDTRNASRIARVYGIERPKEVTVKYDQYNTQKIKNPKQFFIKPTASKLKEIKKQYDINQLKAPGMTEAGKKAAKERLEYGKKLLASGKYSVTEADQKVKEKFGIGSKSSLTKEAKKIKNVKKGTGQNTPLAIKVKDEINKLNKSEVKNLIKQGKSSLEKVISKTANVLNINKDLAARRLGQLIEAYAGDDKYIKVKDDLLLRKAGPLIKGLGEIGGSRLYGGIGGGLQRMASERGVAKDLGKTSGFFSSLRKRINELIPGSEYQTDEIKNIRSSSKFKTSPYSAFIQGIRADINQEKGKTLDKQTSIYEGRLQNAKTLDEKKLIANEYNKKAREFAAEANKNLKSGQPPVRTLEISFDKPNKVIKNKSALDNYGDMFDDIYKKHGYSFKVPADVKSIDEIKPYLEGGRGKGKMLKMLAAKAPRIFAIPAAAYLGYQGITNIDKLDPFSSVAAAEPDTPIEYNDEAGAFLDPKTEQPVSNRTMLEWAADNPMPTAAIASAPLLSKTVRQGTGKLLKGLLSTLASPLAATGFAGATIKANLDEGKNIVDATVDPMVGIELLYPEAAKRIGAKGITGALGKALSLGRVGSMLTPVGAGITALGLGKMGYNAIQAEKEKLAGMSDEEREAYLAQAQEQMDLSA
jgi:hypothetical protein